MELLVSLMRDNKTQKTNLEYLIAHYTRISEIGRSIEVYPEFQKQYTEIISKKSFDASDMDKFLTSFFKKVLRDKCALDLKTINDYKTSTQLFAENQHAINGFIEKLPKVTTILAHYNLLKKLQEQEEIVDEKIRKSKLDNARRLQDYGVNLFFTILGTILGWILAKMLG